MSTTIILAAKDLGMVVRETGIDVLMDELIKRIDKVCQDFDSKSYSVPARSGFHYTQPVTGLIEWMPVMQRGEKATVKLVSYHPGNPTTEGLPTILSSILVFDTRNGHLTGIVDGTFLTALRTGAASAVASRVLALPNSTTLGLIGCGAQAVTQLHALSRVFPIEKVLVHDIDNGAVKSFSERIRYLGLDSIVCVPAEVEEIVSNSDILCTCTSIEIAEGPVFADTETKPHLHVNAVGSDFPGKTELPRSLLTRSLVCPDFLAQAMVEGECQQLREDEIGVDLAELVSKAKRYYTYRNTTTVFDSTGWALEDHIAGEMLIEHAFKHGIGEEIELESVSADPKDPYGFAFDEMYALPAKLAVAD